MKKYVDLLGKDRIELYEYYYTNDDFVLKFIDSNALEIRNFFGKGIIEVIEITDEENKIIEYKNINMKYNQMIVEDIEIFIYDDEGIGSKKSVEMITVILKRISTEEEIVEIKKMLDVVNVDELTFNELREYKIKQSKSSLEKYLFENPLVSKCHNNTEAVYSITMEKQLLMMQNLLMYQINFQSYGEDAELTWNQSGDECETWTVDEFLALIDEVEKIVKPLVSTQQRFEKEIMDQFDMNELKAMSFDYSKFDVRNIVEEENKSETI